MINFLDPKLLPKITRKPLCTETYEADNLISESYADKIRGFIAFPSIKPPVEIEFDLLCNVNISHILLNTTVGNQQCTGIEIFAKASSDEYISLAKAFYDNQGLILCNARKYSKSQPPLGYNENIELRFFKGIAHKTFMNAKCIKIVIFKTKKSVPCLSRVEIWGTPSKTCSKKTIETVYKLNNRPNIPKLTNSEVEKDTFEIPNDFKDDLTYELMTIPYTLPCGKTIDQTTLDKHVEIENSFSRKPCDPFTGKKFTDTLKPILNVALKSRIDMFLLQNSHRAETFGLKRTLRTVIVANNNKCQKLDKNPKDDLDSLIQNAKSDPSFVSFNVSRESNLCNLCKITCDYLYEIPCKDVFCRNCLLEICKNCICVQCDKLFVKSDVKKIDFS
ncbi:unnamed protein product [Ceutorhynchus assimilis]|uniref:U-box domain-containing protein n=1 Tax=Ceutorhynchus assimilis TaxID=467358 RepID=A0A9P0DKF8_9CUCU|nr:unnamed protein product [Ceutorhynchus assimilis]